MSSLQVRKLARLYPKVSTDSTVPSCVTLEKRNLDTALAIEIFLLESELQHRDKILPLLLNLLKCLPSVKFNEASEINRTKKGCLAEEFSFHFVSLLLEIASLEKEKGCDLVLAVLHTFEELVQLCCNIEQQTDVKKGMSIRLGESIEIYVIWETRKSFCCGKKLSIFRRRGTCTVRESVLRS